MEKTNLKGFTLTQMEDFLRKIGEPKYRAKQIFRWIYNKGLTKFKEMTDLPESLINRLQEIAFINEVKIYKKQQSKIDGTVKYAILLEDGHIVETVKMQYSFGTTACVSSQIGCSMGCAFCASGEEGIVRDLSWSEMADQILAIQEDSNTKVRRVVVMGSGEPLLNFDELMRFLKLMNSTLTFNVSLRRLTVSTCGIVPGIIRLANTGMPVTLAVSLHAPNDAIRSSLMPINRRYPISQLLDACKYYIMKTKRRITFEYVMISNINDTKECAIGLSDLLNGFLCHVNLIPINPVKGRYFKKSNPTQVKKFREILVSKGISTTIRREMGNDIKAACGQLKQSL